jgi:hypothetical protein
MKTPDAPKSITPLTAAEVLTTNWADNVRSAALRDGNAIRAGLHANTIEGQSINAPHQWMPILLRNGGTTFATAADRDAVLAHIHRKS